MFYSVDGALPSRTRSVWLEIFGDILYHEVYLYDFNVQQFDDISMRTFDKSSILV